MGVCLNCNGKGVVTCPQCSGTGRVAQATLATQANQTGASPQYASCPMCNGQGHMPCAHCNGKGSATCEKCSGTGAVAD